MPQNPRELGTVSKSALIRIQIIGLALFRIIIIIAPEKAILILIVFCILIVFLEKVVFILIVFSKEANQGLNDRTEKLLYICVE